MWRVLKFLAIVVIVAFLSSAATAHYYRTSGFEAIFPELEDLDMLKMARVVRVVTDYFDTTPEPMMDGALKGLVGSLGDPYTEYLDGEGFDRLNEDTSGIFTGIGVHVGVKDGYITVIAPIKGSPADEVGLRAGDQILAVDGKDITQSSLEEAIGLIRGPAGTQVELGVARDNEVHLFSIVRDNVKVASVEWSMVDKDVGYLRIITFLEGTSKDVAQALEDLQAEGVKGLLLDLRSNPGGLLDEVVKTCRMFVPKGPVLEVLGKDGSRQEYNSTSQGLPYPVVVLIDKGSASASEILAGAIGDRGVGTLVGTPTFGKGSVQSIIDLRDGTGLKITTAKYYTPSGRVIDGNGIEPHVTVNLGEGEAPQSPPKGWDSQVTKALQVLRERMVAPAA